MSSKRAKSDLATDKGCSDQIHLTVSETQDRVLLLGCERCEKYLVAEEKGLILGKRYLPKMSLDRS